MSDEDRKPPEQRKPSESEALLEDLESIRDLLDAERRASSSAPMDDDIPVLREVVQKAVRREPTADQPFAREEAREQEREQAREKVRKEVQTDLFDARTFADRLLDESWQQQSDAILASARRTADALTARLEPQASANARDRLRRRIASELPPLLESLVAEALDELQERLLDVLRNELTRLTEATLTERPQHTSPDDESSHDD